VLNPANFYNKVSRRLRLGLKTFFATAAVFLLYCIPAHSQGLTLTQGQESIIPADYDYVTIGLIALRMVLAFILGLSGIVAFFAGYRWLTHEGNMKKVHDEKKSVARALLVATLAFVALSVLRIFLPDYSLLSL